MQNPIPIQFSHSTGFPAESYTYFFEQLKPHPVSFVPVFGTGVYKLRKSWKEQVPQLIQDIESKHTEPVIGIGHSFGAVLSFWAAIQRPDLFKKIILIDPPFMSRKRRIMMALTFFLGLTDKVVPIARNAKRRRADFASLEEARAYLKPKFLFRNFHPQCFEDYIQHGLVPSDEGFTLRIPSALESRFFATTPYRIGPAALSMPSYYLYPKKGGILTENVLTEHQTKFSNTRFMPIDPGGHMFPLEYPHETADLLKKLIAES